MVGRIAVYDLEDGQRVGTGLDALLGSVGPLAVVSEGAELIALSQWQPAISRWRLDGGGLVNRLIAPGSFLAGGYAQDGHALLTAEIEAVSDWTGVRELVSIRDPATGAVLDTFSAPVSDPAWVGSDAIVGWFPDDGAMRLVDAHSGEDIGSPLPGRSFRSWTTHAGTRLYLLSEDGWIMRVDPATGEQVGQPIVVDGVVAWLSESPDGRRIAITSEDDPRGAVVTIVDAGSGRIIRSGAPQDRPTGAARRRITDHHR